MNITPEQEKFIRMCFDDDLDSLYKQIHSINSVNFEVGNGHYPLKWAILHENYELIDLLIENGAIVNWIDDKGYNPLKHVKSLKMLNVLMSYGLDVHHNEEVQNSGLFEIILFGEMNVAKALISFDVAYKHLSISKASRERQQDIKQYIEVFESILEKNLLTNSFQNELVETKTSTKKKI